ncbi:cryptochrome/deoxyribodipyrimidine photo-lyase family protein [Rubritalea marina]|uniref:cryptochrome/deoxyribodipyrimidine photo-lyase family protein n=1 Tax=Rubritalea marina TaxID=361055 RepID=UPI00037E72E7|nr:cryptochrome/deoxyribodipyrimidine photo-lyase family protein [Rubritalea marina]
MHLVWFKRDLRVCDHRVLHEVAARCAAGEQMLGVYVYEPLVYEAPDFDVCHLRFINECLIELRQNIEALGGTLLILQGEVLRVFEQIRKHFGVTKLWAHEENGNALTFARDLRVAEWAGAQGVEWQEFYQNGVVRRLRNRDGWADQWRERMDEPAYAVPERLSSPTTNFMGDVLNPEALGLKAREMTERQVGGESQAHDLLDSFLHERGMEYRTAMSSPVTGYDACSRISPYLSYGAISVRHAYQIGRARYRSINKETVAKGTVTLWKGSVRSYLSRLRWHCHFMQKMEDQWDIDVVNIARAYDGLRGDHVEWLEAWAEGRTGYPMVDACMRALRATGWLNFRMRAMVMSFASYHLWLDWRATGIVLARYFVDYEPGIHWSQVQMQSGTTGINSVRVYSPIKQVEDQDPEGVFIRKWVPELANVPSTYLAQPELMPELEQQFCGCVIGVDYPAPLVVHAEAYKKAQQQIRAVRANPDARAEAQQVYQKHGSRSKRRR